MNLGLPLSLLWPVFLMFLLHPTQAASLKGQRLKVTGRWNGSSLLIYKVKFRDPRKNPKHGQISGIIGKIDFQKKQLSIGPIAVYWHDKTRFQQLEAQDLKPGKAVKVKVKINQKGELIAKTIQAESDNFPVDEIVLLGAVENTLRLSGDRNRIIILGITGVVPERLTNPTLQLTRRQDDARPEDQFRINLFGRPLIIGGEFGLTPRYEEDLKLDPDKDDDRLRLSSQLQLEIFYAPTTMTAIFLEGRVDGEIELYREGGRDKTVKRRVRRGETWFFWGDILESGVSFQIGRQNFQDRREWWWDANLDAARIYYTRPFFHFELGIGQEALVLSTDDDGIDAKQDDVLRILSRTRWQWDSSHALSFFFLHQLDHSSTGNIGDQVREKQADNSDATLTWGGMRATGSLDLGDHLEMEYWLDNAWMGGRERRIHFGGTDKDSVKRIDAIDGRDVFGWAVDSGVILETDLPFHPTFTLAYAVGSREFRQTGLQDNNVRFRGVDRFRLYGELLRPELSNLHIWTVALGFPLLQSSSVEILYHKYNQVRTEPFLRKARLRAKPNGDSRDIGHELNIVLGLEEWKRLELELTLGMFWAGEAFDKLEGKTAWNAIFKMNYNF
ncbi:MAG: hypothetical protein AXA67_05830 [Methylothermaceae bacteria B42]|nr:MAG: hypothetical protein AXA67_05830 [Methylothermaceae bacteria B42]HHJ38679.1 hypothetical protein [Methylothermaceae bacterium]